MTLFIEMFPSPYIIVHMKEDFRCSSSYVVILSAIAYLTDKGLCTTSKGLFDILTGIHFDEQAKGLDCYGHYSSLGRRTFYAKIRSLERYSYLKYRYVSSINDYILVLTDLGKSSCKDIKWHKHQEEQTNILKIKEIK